LRNIERDKKVNEKLRGDGWIVIRFFESTIKKQRKTVPKKFIQYILKKP
tara:strand:+ start:419 stop:565 length:147 start_codon:yes stop_codon:yes gene_type:complete